MLIVIAVISFAVLAWFRPYTALGVLLLLIPFGHLVRFSVTGVPFTFPESAMYVLAGVVVWRARHSFGHCELGEAERGNPGLHVQSPGLLRSLCSLAMTSYPWVVLPLLWILIAAIAAWSSPNALRAWGIWKAYFVAPVVLFWTVRALMRLPLPPAPPSPRCGEGGYGGAGFRSIISALALGAFVVAVIAIVQRWWPIGVPYPWNQPGQFRATSVFGYPNAVGLSLAPLVPLMIGAAITLWLSLRAAAKQSRRSARMDGIAASSASGGLLAMTIGLSVVAFLSLCAIILAQSTGALVALAVGMSTLFFLRFMRQRGGARTGDAEGGPAAAGLVGATFIVAWIAISLLLTAWLPNQPARPRWGSPLVQKLTFQKWSGSVRLAQYRETWELLRDHPIRGAGLAGYQQAIRPYHEDPRVEIFLYPHNLLLAVWVELGLTGLLVFLAILYQFFKNVFRSPLSVFSIAMIASMVVILVHGLVDVPYFKNDLATVFWTMIGLAIIVGRKLERTCATT